MLNMFTRSEKARRSSSRPIALVGALLISFGAFSLSSNVVTAAAELQDFEGFADTAAAEAGGWFASYGDGGGAGMGIEDQSGNTVLSIGWNTASGWAAIGQNLSAIADWSSYDGVRFWMKGSGNGGSFNFEVQTDNGDTTTAMAHGAAISDDTGGEWTLVSVPFSTLTNGYGWNNGGSTLNLTQVKSFLFSGFVGSDNGGAKIDQFELYNTGDPTTALGPCPNTMLNDFESYADAAAAEAGGWFASYGDGGGAGMGIEDQSGNTVLSIGWNTASGWAAIGQNLSANADWSSYDGVRFWMKGSGNGGSFNFEVQTDNGDTTTAMAYGSAISDNTGGEWTLVSVPFSTLTNGHGWNGGGSTLDLTQVKSFLFSGFVGSDNGGAKIDQFELYDTGDPQTPLGPSTTTTTTVPAGGDNGTTTTTTAAPATTAAPTTTVQLSCPAVTTSVETFESYDAGTEPPTPRFNYNNAGGGISIIEEDGARAREDQSGQNKIFAWGFDATTPPGYGGVGQNFTTALDWSEYTGIQFWMWGSGEGGELQVEIGEDKTSDVERYRSAALNDDWTGWKLVKLPFSSFSASSYNPNPGNGRLDLTTVNNLVFAANSGKTVGGVALDDISVYCVEGAAVTLPATGSTSTNSTSGVAVLSIIAGLAMMLLTQARRREIT